MASQCYECCLKKGKSQFGSKNSYHISVLLTLSSSLKIGKSVDEPLALFRHTSRCQEHKGSEISLLYINHSLIIPIFLIFLVLLICQVEVLYEFKILNIVLIPFLKTELLAEMTRHLLQCMCASRI